jgi:hypothetical protein
MSNESTTNDKEQAKKGPQTWQASFGRSRFRAQWDREPGHVWFHFQGPYMEENDPDGMGTPFTPDFGVEWERGRGARTYGEYDERLDDFRQKTEKAARRAAERASHYAKRATQQVRDRNWDAIERDVRTAMDKAVSELEETLRRLRREWEKRQGESQSTDGKKGSGAQRVPVEYDAVEETLDEEAARGYRGTPSTSASTYHERDVQRRAILEELSTGKISLDEAERRLRDLS